ncbi:hypothetical protein EO244_12215 [Ancylomarina salipaludis]|uniref:Uncharacterized protein n=1 Tax=Ancylomarina salipaludis TaxID=2501299 RepID=A0A4Q1JKS2_9BACT|nr:hypothetical protein [Ancylomarina salipaludis]RXQ91508.1 hypothetical protein EO244_12215 [Ancylomarina salipaludis]
MKQLFILFILATLGFQSCNVGTSGTWKDENIDQSLKNEIETLDKIVLEAITTNNVTLLKSIMSDKLLEKSGSNIKDLIKQVNGIIMTTEYDLLNQFHVKNSKTGIGNTVVSGLGGQDDYIIHYEALNKEMFISILIPENKLDKLSITNIYGKYHDGWKLNILQFGQYIIAGKTATQLYAEAKIYYDKKHLVDAANSMFLSSQVAHPANKFWQYQNEDEMKEFYKTIMAEVKSQYTFPLTIGTIESKPQILNIFPLRTQEGYFHMVEYLTKIDLKDTTLTKEENDKIHQSIGQIFKGLDKDKKYLLYKAFSKMPDGKTQVPTYGFVKEIK